MTVHVLQARGVPSKGKASTHSQVRLLILPSKKQKHKTKIRSGENPQFMESYLLHRVNPEEVNSMGLRIRLYGCERMRRGLIGETIISFATIDLELETNLWLPLEPRTSSVVSVKSNEEKWILSLIWCYLLNHLYTPTVERIVERFVISREIWQHGINDINAAWWCAWTFDWLQL